MLTSPQEWSFDQIKEEKQYFVTIKPEIGSSSGLELEPLMNESEQYEFESTIFQY